MSAKLPAGEVDPGFENAELFWLTTVRPDGRPHAPGDEVVEETTTTATRRTP